MLSRAPRLHCRQIGEADIAAVATLLGRGFPDRTRRFWLDAFARLTRHEQPVGLPKYGYLLESDRSAVGALLLICATVPAGNAAAVRCNVSSWYVEPRFRAYAPLLVSQALRHKNVTYLNVSPAPHTWPIIEAQGFSRYCDGAFVAAPMLNGPFFGAAAVFSADRQPDVGFDPRDQNVLKEHAAYGCLSLWCASRAYAYPFVFRPRLIKGIIPCAQMIYCRDVEHFIRFAGPIGRYLAVRGWPLVMIDANAPISGLIGAFRRSSPPKYFRGPHRPRLGDLAYTECAVLGV